MRIAAAQILTGRDPSDNLRLVRESVAEAAARGARVVVFPEATMRAFGSGRLDEIAEPLDGPWATSVAASAREHGVLVVVGMFTPGQGGRVRNTLLVTGPAGSDAAGGPERELHLGYDKIHLFDAFGFAESDTVEPGDATRVVAVDGVGVGVSVCYDIRFPGQYTALAAAGARLILCSASWGAGPGKVDQWRLLARARALDSTTFLLAVGQADPTVAGVEVKPGAPTGVGHSLFVGPDGTVRAEAGAGSELLVVDVDDDEVTDIRKVIPVLANGRVTEESTGGIPR
ncbi:nitrilase-related carbon-nitrogen hydrolase [Dietzia sp. ANT_WB102]|uniref:nitrilase-related carbon-nitrogen hydrolase n=1 Tax=Dietzia sp. ANT_WB102 TaxID=2597345 RepID=UPI0011ED3888|nr:nitrilase-related carbon-nitrogen hydrolase [Dietzia sp. ANT_WB102]KAA0918720.1 hydrolase [Dietzia sp. ANT_WB102]